MDTNQWNVMSLEAFRFYNCPDCDEKFTLKNTFVEHALMTHKVSQKYIPAILQNKMSIASVTTVTEPPRATVTNKPVTGITITKVKKKIVQKSTKTKINEKLISHKRVREKDEFIDKIKQLKSCGLTVTRSLATVGEIVQKPSVTLPFFGVTPAEKSVTEPLLSQLKNKNVTITPLQSVTTKKPNETVSSSSSVTIQEINDIVTPVTPMPNMTPVPILPDKENNNSTEVTPMSSSSSMTIQKINDIVTPLTPVTPMPKVTPVPIIPEKENNNSTEVTPMSSSSSVTIQKMNETVTPVTPVTPMPNVTSTIPVQSFPEKENNNNFTKGIQHSLRNKKEFNYGNYKCGICQKSLQSTEQLKLHIDVVHLGIQNTQFHRCDQCPQKFKMKSQLNKHVIMDHCDEEKMTSVTKNTNANPL